MIRDLLVFGGLALVAAALWSVDWRLAAIVGGSFVIWLGLFWKGR